MLSIFEVLFLLISGFVIYCLTRLYIVLKKIWLKRTQCSGQYNSLFSLNGSRSKAGNSVKIMIVAGSGGHTAEILKLVDSLDELYRPRDYVVADTDKISCNKIKKLEETRGSKISDYTISTIPRSREVRQSWATTIITTLKAMLYSVSVVFRSSPDVLLCNGPGTCVPLCLTAFIFNVLGIQQSKIIFVESICRVKTMSLTGRILYYLADHIIVQWPELQERYPYTTYMGRIV